MYMVSITSNLWKLEKILLGAEPEEASGEAEDEEIEDPVRTVDSGETDAI